MATTALTWCLALGLASGCASARADLPALDLDALDAFKKKHADADGIVLEDKVQIDYVPGENGEPAARVTTDYAVLIRTEAGRERFGQAEMGYRAALQDVLAFEAKVIRPGGDVDTYHLADADEGPSYARWVLYSDSRKLRMPFPRPPVGSIVQTRSVVLAKRMHLFSRRFFLGSSGVPSLSAIFDVCRPPGWDIDSRAVFRGKLTSHKATKRTVDGNVCDRFAAKDIVPRSKSEAMSPRFSDYPEIIVRLSKWTIDGKTSHGFATPKALSAWEYTEHYQPMREVNADIANLAAEIVASVPPRQEDQAAALYAWVRDNITYCAIELGMGGWKPYPATKVRAMRYGDCKDKATFLSGLLKSQGIASRPAGIYSHKGYPHPFTLPVLGRFNHAILVVDLPSGPVVVDPTTRTVPFGRLPVSDENAPILPVGEGGSELMTTEIAPPKAHRQKLIFIGEMDARGNVEGAYRFDAGGSPAWSFRYDLLTTPRGLWPKATERALQELARVKVSTSEIEAAAPPATPTPVMVKGTASMEIELLGRERVSILRLPELTTRSIGRIKFPRTSPIVFKHNRIDAVQLALTLPKGTKVSTPPPPTHLDTDFAAYDQVVHADASGRLIVDRTFVIKKPIVEAEHAKAVWEFLEAVAKAENQAVVLRRQTPLTSARTKAASSSVAP